MGGIIISLFLNILSIAYLLANSLVSDDMLNFTLATLLKFVAPKEKPVQQQASATKAEKALTMEDIKDDDMMAAALVATIDYHEETGENVRVVSIKEIK